MEIDVHYRFPFCFATVIFDRGRQVSLGVDLRDCVGSQRQFERFVSLVVSCLERALTLHVHQTDHADRNRDPHHCTSHHPYCSHVLSPPLALVFCRSPIPLILQIPAVTRVDEHRFSLAPKSHCCRFSVEVSGFEVAFCQRLNQLSFFFFR